MQSSFSLEDRIKREYIAMQKEREQALKEQQQEVYAKIPEVKVIDDKIASLAITQASRILAEGITPEEAIEVVNREKELLTKKKREILDSYGYIFEPIPYRCNLCNDTGTYNGGRCKCYMEILNKLMLAGTDGSKNVSLNFAKDNFSNFNLDLYSKNIDSSYSFSPYENMIKVYRDCRDFCNTFGSSPRNLYFYGKSGTGKTFMANCIANEIIGKGYSFVYQSAYKMFQFMEDFKFGKIDRAENNQLFENIYNCDLLIIDDLGTEFNTAYTCSVLFDILNTRIINEKSTIISSNLSLTNLEKKYTDRVSSRIIGYFEVMKFIGDDIRVARVKNRGMI